MRTVGTICKERERYEGVIVRQNSLIGNSKYRGKRKPQEHVHSDTVTSLDHVVLGKQRRQGVAECEVATVQAVVSVLEQVARKCPPVLLHVRDVAGVVALIASEVDEPDLERAVIVAYLHEAGAAQMQRPAGADTPRTSAELAALQLAQYRLACVDVLGGYVALREYASEVSQVHECDDRKRKSAIVSLVALADHFVTSCEQRGYNLDSVSEVVAYSYGRDELFLREHVEALETIIIRHGRAARLTEQTG
jgi:hypothetical protein